MIGHNQMTQEKDDTIFKLKEIVDTNSKELEILISKKNSNMIDLDKTNDQLLTCQKDLTDTVSKLHTTNKARHETEIRLGEAMEQQKIDKEALKLKDEMISRKNNDSEEYDKRIVELMRTNESLDTKKQGIERQFELTKKQLNEKINNLNEIINGEKETREMWIERYEKEQKEHNITNAQLL